MRVIHAIHRYTPQSRCLDISNTDDREKLLPVNVTLYITLDSYKYIPQHINMKLYESRETAKHHC